MCFFFSFVLFFSLFDFVMVFLLCVCVRFDHILLSIYYIYIYILKQNKTKLQRNQRIQVSLSLCFLHFYSQYHKQTNYVMVNQESFFCCYLLTRVCLYQECESLIIGHRVDLCKVRDVQQRRRCHFYLRHRILLRHRKRNEHDFY